MKRLIKKLLPTSFLGTYHYLLSFFGALFYGFPSKKIKVIGVTGTGGKTTIVDFIVRILEEAEFNVASISSIKFKIKEKEWDNKLKMTMPGRFFIQKFIKKAVKNNCDYLILEVTSEGIKQHRHRFIKFNTAVFSNLSLEHIESHGGFENYRNAKLDLFRKTKNIHVINLDDKNSEHFLKIPSEKKILYSTNKSNDLNWDILRVKEIEEKIDETKFKVEETDFSLKVIGTFNIKNALAAISATREQGVSLETCSRALSKVEGVPGRMEVLVKEPFSVIVDYAHYPDALLGVYETLSQFKKGKMICVLGSCGGGRDKWKRPILGEIALKYCEEIIITNEDPYEEDPLKIIEEVAEGSKGKAQKILDRKEAIEAALKKSSFGDTVIITGKGSEPWMCINKGRKIPWDDRKIVKDFLSSH